MWDIFLQNRLSGDSLKQQTAVLEMQLNQADAPSVCYHLIEFVSVPTPQVAESPKHRDSIIRNVSETVVKIPNSEITIQEGNRFRNNIDEDETIIIGDKMSTV